MPHKPVTLLQHELAATLPTLAGVDRITLTLTGDGAYYNSRDNVINLPAIHEDTEVTPKGQAIMRGYLHHEAEHVVSTPDALWKRIMDDLGTDAHSVLNCIEDTRIEAARIARYPGSKSMLEATCDAAFGKNIEVVQMEKELGTFDPLAWIPLGIAVRGRLTRGGYNAPEMEALWNEFPVELQQLVDTYMPEVNALPLEDGPELQDKLPQICARVWNDMQTLNRKRHEEAKKPKENTNEQEPPAEIDINVAPIPESEPVSDSDEAVPSEPNNDSSDDAPEDADVGEPAADGGEVGGLIGDDDGDGGPTLNRTKQTRKQDLKETDDSEPEPEPDDKPAPLVVKDPSLSNLMRSALEDELVGEGYAKSVLQPPYLGNDTVHDETKTKFTRHRSRAGMVETTLEHIQEVKPMIGRLSARLTDALRAKTEGSKERGKRNGVLDRSALVSATLGNRFVYSQTGRDESIATAVTLLVDQSGSMRGAGKREAALQAVYAIASVCERNAIPFEIVGFRQYGRGRFSEERLRHETMYPDSRIGASMHHIYNTWNQRLSQTPDLPLVMSDNFAGSNADATAVSWAYGRLKQRSEPRKVLMVLSDGQPATDAANEIESGWLKRTVSDIEKTPDVEIIGVGILSGAVQSYYSNCVVVSNVADLGGVAAKQLAKILIDSNKGAQ